MRKSISACQDNSALETVKVLVGRDGKRLSSTVYDYTFSVCYPCFADLGMPLPAIYPLCLADEFADA